MPIKDLILNKISDYLVNAKGKSQNKLPYHNVGVKKYPVVSSLPQPSY